MAVPRQGRERDRIQSRTRIPVYEDPVLSIRLQASPRHNRITRVLGVIDKIWILDTDVRRIVCHRPFKIIGRPLARPVKGHPRIAHTDDRQRRPPTRRTRVPLAITIIHRHKKEKLKKKQYKSQLASHELWWS